MDNLTFDGLTFDGLTFDELTFDGLTFDGLTFDLFGWFGNVFIIISMVLVVRKSKWGFASGILGNLLWVVKGFFTGQWDLITLDAIIIVVQSYGFYQWHVGTINKSTARPICK
jgi:hypothetical protein